jgi:hypothetical protein
MSGNIHMPARGSYVGSEDSQGKLSWKYFNACSGETLPVRTLFAKAASSSSLGGVVTIFLIPADFFAAE